MANVGDIVQIRNGAIDVTDGARAKAGRLYGEGGPLWATVVAVVDGWATGSRWGLPPYVTKVRCAGAGGVIVWQVQPQDIAGQFIQPQQVEETNVVQTTEVTIPNPVAQAPPVVPALAKASYNDIDDIDADIGSSNRPFSPDGDSDTWYDGNRSTEDEDDDDYISSHKGRTGDYSSIFDIENINMSYKTIVDKVAVNSMFSNGSFKSYLSRLGYTSSEINNLGRQLKRQATVPARMEVKSVMRAEYQNSWQNSKRRIEMLNGNKSVIQNAYKFPFVSSNYSVSSGTAAKYDYQFIPNDPRLPSNSPVRNLENRLMELRAALGIPVHGNNDIARSMAMYMYNRFKVPDTNIAHNRSTTHIFFSRPDLNIMDGVNEPAKQVNGHTDTALLWRTHPEIFKLLTDYRRCGDNNNLNLLLSNRITSFNLDDEKISTVRGGKSWAEHEMVYGEQYTGRTAGEFSCTFEDTANYDIINMMKLWITYIDNVSRGAWSPYYEGNSDNDFCHVFDRALDYAASVYVFKCGPDGEEILYWSKYYGVFPITTGSNILSWEKSNPIGDGVKPSISFAYSFKKDLSPISLLEFNHIANATTNEIWVPSYDVNLGHCARPYVGAPYIEIDLGTPNMKRNDVNRSTKRTQIRLKFRNDTSSSRTDEILFKSNSAKH